MKKKKAKKIVKENKRLRKENKVLHKDIDALVSEGLSVALEVSYYKEKEMESTTHSGVMVISDIEWNGDETTVLWEDGTKTTVRKAEPDAYDRRTAVAYAIAKKVLVGGLSKTVDYYSEEGKQKRDALLVYRTLTSCKDPEIRKAAEGKWKEFPRSIRQAAKAAGRLCGSMEPQLDEAGEGGIR